jgi:CheY-like chemotaxis protein
MEALGQLAGGIAHDFNNVLQAVGGGAGLILRRPDDVEGVRRIARMVVEAAERGSAVTRRLLAFSRRGELRAEPVDPAALLTDLREVLTHTLGAGIGVRVETGTHIPSLLADKGQLETVLVNLSTNARDAMAGQGLLTLSATVEVLTSGMDLHQSAPLAPGTYLRMTVADTGAGMTPEVLIRATEPFFTTKAQGKGTGLGLAMARGFAEQSGGGLTIKSAVGCGTAVHLWLPIAEAETPVAVVQADIAAAPVAARILLVDDEEVVRTIIAEGLRNAGYSVLAAAGGREALALLDAGDGADLLISDLSMPDMDGLTVVREVQRRRPGLPAILLTGFATNAAEAVLGGAMGGAFSLLRKPVNTQELAERATMLLVGRRLIRAEN